MATASTPIEPVRAECLPWQREIIAELLSLKQRERLPHALLIELETTVDSAAFGWQLVTVLLCERPENGEFCGSCAHCNLMHANSHPDFTYTTLVEDAKTHKMSRDIKIDQIRRLIHQLNLTDSMQQGRYALIYPAERMSTSAANSLLKTLEEPADGSTLIVLTHHASRLPVTIRSRCQKWRLKNPARSIALDWLETQSLTSELAETCLELAAGDAQYARHMYAEKYLEAHQALNEILQQFYLERIDVVTAVAGLKGFDASVLRHLVRSHYLRKLRELSAGKLSPEVKDRMTRLLDLINHNERVLRSDDHNLNVLLQLEDVLISGKQALSRG
jgi:DNA polymerase-3 subunit delta'